MNNNQESLTISLENGEGLLANLLDIREALGSRVCSRLVDGRLSLRDSLGAVNELVSAVAENCHLCHGLQAS